MGDYQANRAQPGVQSQEHLTQTKKQPLCHSDLQQAPQEHGTCRSVGGWKDKSANLFHRVEAAGHAWESARCWGQAHITRPGAQLTEVLDFWFSVRERKVMGTYTGLGKGRMWQ